MFMISFMNEHPLALMVFQFAGSFVLYMVLLLIIFTLMDIRASAARLFICTLCTLCLRLLPIFTASAFIRDPLAARVWIYGFFLLINPFFALVFYFIVRRVLRFSPTRATILMQFHMLLHYISAAMYLALNDFLTGLLRQNIQADGFFAVDYISLLIVTSMLAIFWLCIRWYLRKSRKYIVIPPSYAEKNVPWALGKTLLAISFFYFIYVLFRITLFPDPVMPLTSATFFIYLMYILSAIFYLLYTIGHFRSRLQKWELQATGTYISSLLNVNQQFRGVKHDFYNILQVYGGYLAIDDYEGLKEYHQTLFHTTRQAGAFLRVIETLRSRVAVYSLLEAMAEKAKRAGVAFAIDQVCDISEVTLNDVDLCRVLSVVLDNAIEAAELSAGQQAQLSIERKDESAVVIAVSNSTGCPVDTLRIWEDGYSTKSNHTGIGLSQALRILRAYEDCFLHVHYHENQFTAFLILTTGGRVHTA